MSCNNYVCTCVCIKCVGKTRRGRKWKAGSSGKEGRGNKVRLMYTIHDRADSGNYQLEWSCNDTWGEAKLRCCTADCTDIAKLKWNVAQTNLISDTPTQRLSLLLRVCIGSASGTSNFANSCKQSWVAHSCSSEAFYSSNSTQQKREESIKLACCQWCRKVIWHSIQTSLTAIAGMQRSLAFPPQCSPHTLHTD